MDVDALSKGPLDQVDGGAKAHLVEADAVGLHHAAGNFRGRENAHSKAHKLAVRLHVFQQFFALFFAQLLRVGKPEGAQLLVARQRRIRHAIDHGSCRNAVTPATAMHAPSPPTADRAAPGLVDPNAAGLG